MDQQFHDAMAAGYALTEPAILLGRPMLGAELAEDVAVQVALSMLNRHGLVAGATGTGKTKTLQLLAGELSKAGVPVFIADIKGDLTGMAAPGDGTNQKTLDRSAQLCVEFVPSAHPVEFLSLSGHLGAQVRASVHSFGPLLLGKVLDLNDTQTSILSLVFKYCDDQALPLLNLEDLSTTLKYLASDDGKAILADYGGISPASLGVILRAIVGIEQEGADIFFGEPEFDVADLMRLAPAGEGVVSVLELSDVMDKPRLFSTFMLWMLAQLYHALPEVGDLPKPKLAFFFDEAHLLFHDASEALLEQVERTVRLIRSKGVGVYFATQVPSDIPGPVLAQLGNRFEHALRAFTPEDADNLKKTVRTFPITKFYNVEETVQSLGTGEALVTVLSPRGVPTPLAATRLRAPDSLMAALDPATLQRLIANGPLTAKYGTPIDPQSAHEIIEARIAAARQAADAAAAQQAGYPPYAGAPGYSGSAGPAGYPAPGYPAPSAYPSGGPPYPGTLTPAQQQREIQRQAKELERQRKAVEREAAAQARADERAHRAEERQRAADARAARRERDTMIRTGARVLTSRTGQQVLRGVFGTLFGGRR